MSVNVPFQFQKEHIPYLIRKNPAVWAVASGLKIPHPTRGTIPLDLYDYQVAYLSDRSRFKAILKARQVGMSLTMALEALHTAIWNESATVLLVSRNERQALNLLRYCKEMLRSVPKEQYGGRLATANQTEMEFLNGARIMSETAAEGTGRGFAGSLVIFDEAAWAQYAERIYQSILPAISQGGRISILSTPNGRGGIGSFFFKLFATSLGDAYTKHRIPWYRCKPYNPDGYREKDPVRAREIGEQSEWYRVTRPAFSDAQWSEEYDCDFLTSGNPFFQDAFIDRMALDWKGFRPPVEGQRYLKAFDIGRRNDPTVALVADITDFSENGSIPADIVWYERRLNMPYDAIVERIMTVHKLFPGDSYIESNGPGDPVLDMLNAKRPSGTGQFIGYWTTKTRKEQALDAFKLLLEKNLFSCGVQQLMDEMRIYVLEQDKELVQDSIMAASILARQLVTRRITGGWIIGDYVHGV